MMKNITCIIIMEVPAILTVQCCASLLAFPLLPVCASKGEVASCSFERNIICTKVEGRMKLLRSSSTERRWERKEEKGKQNDGASVLLFHLYS